MSEALIIDVKYRKSRTENFLGKMGLWGCAVSYLPATGGLLYCVIWLYSPPEESKVTPTVRIKTVRVTLLSSSGCTAMNLLAVDLGNLFEGLKLLRTRISNVHYT
jgi:hypothetical protein